MRREVMATGRVTLPILTFEESMLSPSFGYVFNPHWLDPQESIVSILWKFARMNVLSGHTIAAQLAKTCIDPYEGILASRTAVDMRRLHQMLGLQRKLIRGALIPDTLRKISSVHFRFCPRCLRRGYHSVVHQLETVHHCPIHGDWLQVQCSGCGQCAPYRLNARLLGAPFRCADCGAFYGLYAPSFLKRKPLLTQQQRVAITRLKLHYFCS